MISLSTSLLLLLLILLLINTNAYQILKYSKIRSTSLKSVNNSSLPTSDISSIRNNDIDKVSSPQDVNSIKPKTIFVSKSRFDYIQLNDGMYVDKTKEIHDNLLSKGNGYYFLVRPRRFGKSLLCSTLSNLFVGKQKEVLFQDLWIGRSGVWDFEKEEHPVIHLDMSNVAGENSNIIKFERKVKFMLENIARSASVELNCDKQDPIELNLQALIGSLEEKFKKPVVIIIDEYDKPILDLINKPKEMEEVRESLQSFYAVLKSQEVNLRLVFITGLYKFTQTSMFSTLNNLRDLSLSLPAGTLVGYTENEIKENFRDHIELLTAKLKMTETDLMNKLREQYNGYRFGVDTGDGNISEPIYNPFAINYIFEELQFTDKWILSGSASMLAKKLSSSGDRYEDYLTTSMSELEEACKPDEMTLTSLMYYGGYSTIDKVGVLENQILLKIPNRSIYKYLAKDYLKAKFSVSDIKPFVTLSDSIYDIMTQTPINEMMSKTEQEMSKLLDNVLNKYTYLTITSEGEFRNIVDSVLKINFDEKQIHHEVLTLIGRIDTIITLRSRIFIIEYKYIKDSSEALEQIHDREYYGRYLDAKVPVILLGISCKKEDKRKVNISCEIKNNEK